MKLSLYPFFENFKTEKVISKGDKLDDIGAEVGMSKQIISKILKNKTYIGKYSYDGKIENNNINFKVDRIISNYIYNKVNKGGLNP